MKTAILMLFAVLFASQNPAWAGREDDDLQVEALQTDKALDRNVQRDATCPPGDKRESDDPDAACVRDPAYDKTQVCDSHVVIIKRFGEQCDQRLSSAERSCEIAHNKAMEDIKKASTDMIAKFNKKAEASESGGAMPCKEMKEQNKVTLTSMTEAFDKTCNQKFEEAERFCRDSQERVRTAMEQMEVCDQFSKKGAMDVSLQIERSKDVLKVNREKNREIKDKIAKEMIEPQDQAAAACEKGTQIGDGKEGTKPAEELKAAGAPKNAEKPEPSGGSPKGTTTADDDTPKKKKKDGDLMSAMAGALPGMMGMLANGMTATPAGVATPLTGAELDPTSCYNPMNMGNANCLCLMNGQCRNAEAPGPATFASLSPSGGALMNADAGSAGSLDIGEPPMAMPEFKGSSDGGIAQPAGYSGGGGFNAAPGNFKPDPGPGRPRSNLSADILVGTVKSGGGFNPGAGPGSPREPMRGTVGVDSGHKTAAPDVRLFAPNADPVISNAERGLAGATGATAYDKVVLAPANGNLFFSVATPYRNESPYRAKWPTLYVDQAPPN